LCPSRNLEWNFPPIDMFTLRTRRLILREWTLADRKPFAELNADPRVMEFLGGTLAREESDLLADRIDAHFLRHGFGLCATEFREEHTGKCQFIGFVGLAVPSFDAAFTPSVEIGWRLAAGYWGRGFATEGAMEIVRYAFEELRLPSLVSFTATGNARSRRVMDKLRMTRDPAEDFDHPNLPQDHALRQHVLYRLQLSQWLRRPK
jgi:RimJ/RimL family protein N-acetyltransferase